MSIKELPSAVWVRAAKVALVVGTVLVAINHGDAILAGEFPVERQIKSLLTYLVPFCVSIYSAMSVLNQRPGKGSK